MITHTLTKAWSSSVGGQFSGAVAYTGAKEANLNPVVSAGATNVSLPLAFTKAGLQCIYIYSDQAVTVKTNNITTPQETLNVAKGIPFVWDNASGIACPFAADVTACFVSNAGATAANITIRCLTNG